MTIVFFLLYDQKDATRPFRAVGGVNIGAPWKYDESFPNADAARDQLLIWICETPNSEFHDLTV